MECAISSTVPRDRKTARYYRKLSRYSASLALVSDMAMLTLGGSLSTNSGSRPTNYYVPRASVVVPATNRVKWVAEWRWYGFGEDFFRQEDFRAHMLSVGLLWDF